MTDLTDAQRVERARQAAMALNEFLDPAFAVVEADYMEKMVNAAASADPRTPEVIARLANGIKAMRSARAQIVALVADGEVAKSGMTRAERHKDMTPSALRLMNIGPN